MKNDGDITEKEFAVAQRILKQAQHEIEAGFNDAAISRSYYAIFHAARATLRKFNSEPITHQGLLSEFGRILVKTGKVEEEYSSILRVARDERQTADYEVYELENLPDEEFARNLVEKAEQFIERMRKLVG